MLHLIHLQNHWCKLPFDMPGSGCVIGEIKKDPGASLSVCVCFYNNTECILNTIFRSYRQSCLSAHLKRKTEQLPHTIETATSITLKMGRQHEAGQAEARNVSNCRAMKYLSWRILNKILHLLNTSKVIKTGEVHLFFYANHSCLQCAGNVFCIL